MTVLLTGATGFLGQNLLRRLPDVVAVARGAHDRTASLERRSGRRLQVLEADITQDRWGLSKDTLESLKGTIDVVVHAAAVTSWTASWSDLIAANVNGSRTAVAIADLLGVPLVHVSSLFASYRTAGLVPQELADETDDLTKYERSKCRAEWAIHDEVARRGVPCTIARVGALVGDDDQSKKGTVAPMARAVAAAAMRNVPYLSDARIDICPRNIAADRLGSLIERVQAGDHAPLGETRVTHLGLGHEAPLVRAVLDEVAQRRIGDLRIRPRRAPRRVSLSASRAADRWLGGPRGEVLIGARYFCSTAIYEGTPPAIPVSASMVADALTGTYKAQANSIDRYYRSWVG